jgi:hypothetical protein
MFGTLCRYINTQLNINMMNNILINVVIIIIPGMVFSIKLPKGATYKDIIYEDEKLENKFNDRKVIIIRNDIKINTNSPLRDGDKILLIKEIKGEAPIDSKESGINELKKFSENANSLIIIDPYIYNVNEGMIDNYLSLFIESTSLEFGKLCYLHIITNQKKINKLIHNKIQEKCAAYKCLLSEAFTKDIHDRIWIKDCSKAIAVGTSLTGIGTRLAFALELPSMDLNFILKYLSDRNLLPSKT